jgi:AmmeMemoRadiSam system protein B
MQTRKPVVAGQFYPAQHNSCIAEIIEFLEQIIPNESLPETITAGIVPHAGWTFSGLLAAMVFAAIKQQHKKVNTFVIFGAAHSYAGRTPAVYDRGFWLTPLGETVIDEDLAKAVLDTKKGASDTNAHQSEHSIEVQLPFIHHLFPGAKVLPIITPPTKEAVELGHAVAAATQAQPEKKIICIGSTDLTHYGPRYGFVPMGTGTNALNWASAVNDKEFIDLALRLKPEEMLASAAQNHNACGAGAAAATAAAAKKTGIKKGLLLAHTNSNEVMQKKFRSSSAESVGYAAIVF